MPPGSWNVLTAEKSHDARKRRQRCGEGRQNCTFDYDAACELRAGGAEGQTRREFLAPRFCPHQQQPSDRRAIDEHKRADGCGEQSGESNGSFTRDGWNRGGLNVANVPEHLVAAP